MQNGIFKLDLMSVVNAVVTAIVFAVITALVTLVSTKGFSIWTTDWGLVGMNMADIGFISAVVSIGRDLMSTNAGSVLNIATPST